MFGPLIRSLLMFFGSAKITSAVAVAAGISSVFLKVIIFFIVLSMISYVVEQVLGFLDPSEDTEAFV